MERQRIIRLAGILALILVSVMSRPSNISAAPAGSVTLTGTLPRPVADGEATRLSSLASKQMVRLAIALQPPHMAQEEQFLHAVQDRNSPIFHHFLTAAQWNRRFAPSSQAERAVVDWARQQGMTITQRYASRLLVDIVAPTGVIDRALNVHINTYRAGTQHFFAPDRNPTIPANLAGIVHAVVGLDNYSMAHPQARVASVQKTRPAPVYVPGPAHAIGPSARHKGNPKMRPHVNTGRREPRSSAPGTRGSFRSMIDTAGSYEPTDIWSAQTYDFAGLQALGHCCNPTNNPSGTPAATSIAIQAWGSFQQSDLQALASKYGLAYNYSVINVDGGSALSRSADNQETTLDVEYATAMSNSFGAAANTAHIYVYESPYTTTQTLDTYNQMLKDGYARVMSSSNAQPEDSYCSTPSCTMTPTVDAFHATFAAMAGQGWTLVAASGDTGAYSHCNSEPVVEYPPSDPNVVAVGGTTLDLNASTGAFNSETTWTGIGCTNISAPENQGGGGGGYSGHFGAPSYQTSAGIPLNAGQDRGVPDVSLDAGAPQAYYVNGGWSATGGTSIGAPEMAGFFAQENAYLLSEGSVCGMNGSPCAPMGDPHNAIYTYGSHPSLVPHDPFYDIASGCNGGKGGTGYCAGPGWDPATGWGAFNALQLAWALNYYYLFDSHGPTVSFTGPQTGVANGSPQTVSWTISDPQQGQDPSVSGVAGYSSAIDTAPKSQASGNRASTEDFSNGFYAGPQQPNQTSGSTVISASGCHYVHVRAWDNDGNGSGDQMYGPVCIGSTATTLVPSDSGPFNPGDPVLADWNNFSPSGSDWISLHPAGAPNENYWGFNMIGGSSGSTQFTAPNSCGRFEFHLLRGGATNAVSNAFTVMPPAPALCVSASQGGGLDTGIDVNAGQTVTVSAHGQATYGPEADACTGGGTYYPRTDPDGNRTAFGTCPPKYDATAALPSAPIGALIGKIGSSGSWFLVGSHYTSPPAGSTGRLYLMYNDSYWADNGGGYIVTVSTRYVYSNPAPTTSGINPISGGVGDQVTVTGSGFVPDSVVVIGSRDASTTYNSAGQLQATVPAGLTAGNTYTVQVVNPLPGGGTSNLQLLFLTQTGAPLLNPDYQTSMSGAVSASSGGITASTNGTGTVVVGQYSADPVNSAPPRAVNAYFDVYAVGGSLTQVTIVDCNLGGGNRLYFFNGTGWAVVSPQSYNSSTGCVTAPITLGSTPNTFQLSGTPFAVGMDDAPPVITLPSALPPVQYSDPLSFPVSATDPQGEAITLSVVGSLPSGLSFRDNGDGTGTVSGQVTVSAGTYPLTFKATGSGGLSSSNSVTLTVTPEDAVVTPGMSNPSAVQVTKAGGSASSMTFTSRITEVADGTYGDISRASPITFTLNPIGSGTKYNCTVPSNNGAITRTVAATSTNPGFEVVSCTFPAGTTVNVYDLNVSVGGAYYHGSADNALTVYDPSQTGVQSGGGLVTNPQTQNTASFGFTASYNSSGGVVGKMLYVETDASGTQIAVLKGNVMATMAITKTNGSYPETAKITGKATLNGNGNYSYILQALDNAGTATDSDQYGIQVTDPSGASLSRLTFTPQTLLKNGSGAQIGNIYVK